MRLSQDDGWLYYSVAPAYYVKVYNEYNSDVKIDYNPYKGIELVNPNEYRGNYV